VSLILHETRRITIALSPGDLSFVTAEGDRRLIPGGYRLTVGSEVVSGSIPGRYASYTLRKKIDFST
jgi:beta-glucosidase